MENGCLASGFDQNYAFLECSHTTYPMNVVLMGKGRSIIVEVSLPDSRMIELGRTPIAVSNNLSNYTLLLIELIKFILGRQEPIRITSMPVICAHECSITVLCPLDCDDFLGVC